MDHRIALSPKTPLCLSNDKGEVIQCVIEREIGRGGSCIVYEVSRKTQTGDVTLYRVKELYPYRLNITRGEDGQLIPAPCDEDAFRKKQEQLLEDYRKSNHLFYSSGNFSLFDNKLDIFYQNGTSYVLSSYSSEKTLLSYKPESLKECISLVKLTAYILGNIHRCGYLYLDVKPDNVLVVDGLQKQVQLFDFDSLISISDISNNSYQNGSETRLSFSRGFAPIELQTSRIRRLGPHTDVYSVGALLYYLLFGTTPEASDCESNAEYDFGRLQFDCTKCDDRLVYSLTEFLRNSLAVYYADRYQTMEEVLSCLERVEKYADVTFPRIFSTKIIKPKFVFGRKRDSEQLDNLIRNDDCNCIFVTGIGGIGKSTFVKNYLYGRYQKSDVVLYMQFNGSIEDMVSADENIEISVLHQDKYTQDNRRYFDVKIKKIRELVRETPTIIAIDNFVGDVDNDLIELLKTGAKVILVTRQSPTYRNCHKLEISAIEDYDSLRQIFEVNLGRPLEVDEEENFREIVNRTKGHTLILELIAKQIGSSHEITLSGVSSIVKEHGFSSIAPERVDYEKDDKTESRTIGDIIDALFEANRLSETERSFMKAASLLGEQGMDINEFHQILELETKDDANELIKNGWLTFSENKISMHPVIQESVQRWGWNPTYTELANDFLSYFYSEIKFESTKNNYPRKMYKYLVVDLHSKNGEKKEWHRDAEEKINRIIERRIEKMSRKAPHIGRTLRKRYLYAKDKSPADLKKLSSLILQAKDILLSCKRDEILAKSDIYRDLLCLTVLNIPDYAKNDKYVEAEIGGFLTEDSEEFILSNKKMLLDMNDSKSIVTRMKLFAEIVIIYAHNGRTEEAEELIEQAKKTAKKINRPVAYAIYYDMLSDYYDILLDGAYDAGNEEEEILLNAMLDGVEKALYYSEDTIFHDNDHLYLKNLLAKATILMRSNRCEKEEIHGLIKKAGEIIAESTTFYADVRLQYYLVCGWYNALICEDEESLELYVKFSVLLAQNILYYNSDKIYKVFIPCANMYYELGVHEKAISYLYEGTRLCTEYANNDFYAALKQELCEHIWEVARDGQTYEVCKEIVKTIEQENDNISDLKNKVIIPEDIRRAVIPDNEI